MDHGIELGGCEHSTKFLVMYVFCVLCSRVTESIRHLVTLYQLDYLAFILKVAV
jgi:hypothetical protein